MVLDLFRVARREPGRPAYLHPHIEIVSLDEGRAHMSRIRIVLDRRLANAGAFGPAVAALRAVRGRAKELYELGVIDITAARPFHGR